jgi:glycerol-3-phosphate dehydrogenase
LIGSIDRDPESVRNNIYDAIIIGGGIHGIMLALIASQRKLKPLLLERDDYGSATSYNSLRIIHGGFRYLQNLDISRFYESIFDRRWFLQNFPDLVKPIPCLIPLYGNGVYRPSIFKAALLLNDFLSFQRNKGVKQNLKISSGHLVSASEIKKIIPGIEESGLKGGAVWYDGAMQDTQRVMIETLKWACSLGAKSLNYFEAIELLKNTNNEVIGVQAFDKEACKSYDFKSSIVINAAGPWSRSLAADFDKDYNELFKSSIAWNILFNKKAPFNYAIAVTPKRENAKTYFLRPLRGKLFAGTVHEPWSGIEKNPIPSESSINTFINDLNSLINNLNLKRQDVLHIFSGYMPVKEEGTNNLTTREIILDHSKKNGPKGLFSISGVKFTTARLVAERTINIIFKNKSNGKITRKNLDPQNQIELDSKNKIDDHLKEKLKMLISDESVLHLTDLVLRRMPLGDDPAEALKIAPQLCKIFEWDEARCELEINSLKEYYQIYS